MCFADGRTSDRLWRRKAGIRKFVLNDAGSLLRDCIDVEVNGNTESYVWVDAEFFRRFLRCDRGVDQLLSSSGSLIRHKHLLCEHNKLHPRVARKGKLLPRQMFDAYVSILKGENALLQEAEASKGENDVVDCTITPSTNMFCAECSKSYQTDLSKKLESLKNIKNLYDALDGPADDSSLYINEGEDPTCSEDAYAYVISRQTATKYKKHVVSLIKTFAKFDEGATLAENEVTTGSQIIFEGLDALDLSKFEFDQLSNNEHEQLKEAPAKEVPDKLDKLFNSNVTCKYEMLISAFLPVSSTLLTHTLSAGPHGKCNVSGNGRVVRVVSWKTWTMLKKVFPDAIEHTIERVVKNGSKGVSKSAIDGCPECQAERASIDRLKVELENWSKESRENFELKGLLQGNRTVEREIEVHNFTTAVNGCRLVHRTDIQTWRNALAKMNKIKSDDTSTTLLKSHVESIAFPSYHSVVLEFERQPVEKMLTSLRSLICRAHKLVIKTAIFRNCADSSNDKDHSHQLSECIAVLSDEEYCAYISSLAELLRILNSDTESNVMGSVGSPVVLDGVKPFLSEVRKITNSYHPAIRMCVEKDQSSSNDILVFSLHGSTKEFLLSPSVCGCETCMKEFAPLLQAPKVGDDDRVENISIDSDDEKFEASRKVPNHGSAAADPIIVESDIDDKYSAPDTFSLRSYEVDPKSTLEDVLRDLRSLSALPAESDTSELNFLRRSTRKRKARYPYGSLLKEGSVKVGLHHNMAALRLLLYEKCEVPVSGRKLILVMSSNNGKHLEALEIKFEWGQKQLQELADDMKEQVPPENETPLDPSTQLLLLYQKEEGGNAPGLHETVMDSLLQLANLEPPDSKDSTSNIKKNKRDRPSERGFRGTLLQSSSAPTSNPSERDAKKQSSSDESSPAVVVPAVSIIVSAVSDDDKDDAQSAQEPTKTPRIVLSDISSDDEILKSPPFARKKPKPHARQFNDAPETNRSKIVVESDSMDEDEDQNDDERKNTPKVCQDVTPEKSLDQEMMINDCLDDELRNAVLSSLLDAVDKPVDQSNCWDAACWAVANNPNEKNQSALLDIALAKYIENQLLFDS